MARARARVGEARSTPRRAWRYGLATAAAVLLIAAAVPAGRTLAQQVWHRWSLTRVAVTRLDTSQLQLETSLRSSEPTRAATSAADASARAGFPVWLPPVDLVGGWTALEVIGRFDVTQVVRREPLLAALRRQGAHGVEVPADWEGVTMGGTIGPIVVARYPGDVELVQSAPFRMDVPADFPLARFMTALFRAGGLGPAEAEALATELAARPAWLLDRPDDGATIIETVRLPRGDGLLVEEASDSGRVSVIVSRPDRIYTVVAPTREGSLRVASALP